MADTPAHIMESRANDAVKHARKAVAIDLDYSAQSIRLLEAKIDALTTAVPSGFVARLLGPPSRALLTGMFGAYLGEVIRRACGWDWSYDRELVRGAKVACLRRGKETIFPMHWVEDRLRKVESRDLWDFFRLAEGSSNSAAQP